MPKCEQKLNFAGDFVRNSDGYYVNCLDGNFGKNFPRDQRAAGVPADEEFVMSFYLNQAGKI